MPKRTDGSFGRRRSLRITGRQFIGDGAPWIENVAKDGFKAAIFTLDCSHAFGYVNKVCAFLARDAKEVKKVFRKVKDRMYEHDLEKAEKYLRNKCKAHFNEDGLKHWSEDAAKAWKYLDERNCSSLSSGVRIRSWTEERNEPSIPTAYCLTPNPWR